MSSTTRIRRRMNDLRDAQERRTTLTLALLVLSIMILPVGASGAQEVEALDAVGAAIIEVPASGADDPEPVAVPPVEVPPVESAPAAEEPAEETPAEEPTEEPSEDGLRGYEVPAAETPEDAAAPPPAPEGGENDDVQAAEGGDTEEVVAPEAAPAAEEGAAADDAAAAEQPVAPPIEIYGPQVVPSLGTASAPRTQEYMATSPAPLVLAPMVAGQQVKPGGLNLGEDVILDKAPLLAAPQSVQRVAAATLSVVEPSWYATAAALAVLFGAAAYAAVLRRRGEEVPEALAFTGAVRPGDLRRAVASVRPADLAVATVRSVRPR